MDPTTWTISETLASCSSSLCTLPQNTCTDGQVSAWSSSLLSLLEASTISVWSIESTLTIQLLGSSLSGLTYLRKRRNLLGCLETLYILDTLPIFSTGWSFWLCVHSISSTRWCSRISRKPISYPKGAMRISGTCTLTKCSSFRA
jgi:hypothetical protein